MGITDALIGIAIAWLITGVFLGYLMRRRGHDFFLWFVMGSILGPLALPIAFGKIREEAHVMAPGGGSGRSSGDFDVLIALDGSPEAEEAMQRAIRLAGSEPTSFTLATVVDYEAQSPLAAEQREAAQQMLDSAATQLPGDDIATEILFGEPAGTLLEYADSTGKDLVVIGARGRGMSERLFGSVASSIVSKSPVPVLVGPRPVRQPLPYMSPD